MEDISGDKDFVCEKVIKKNDTCSYMYTYDYSKF